MLVAVASAACASKDSGVATEAPLRIVAREFAFDAPDTVPAGPVRLTFVNEGSSYHHVQLVRITADVPFSAIPDSLRRSLELPSWLLPVGGAEGADSLPRPVTVSLSLAPGRYFLICRITTPQGEAHHDLGMTRALVVTDGVANGQPVRADTSVIVRDYSVVAADTLTEGTWRFRVRSEGPHEHNVAVARLADGRTLQDVIDQPAGVSAVFEVLGGTAGLGPGQENVLELALVPGRYVYMCFVMDPASKREHYQMGMARELTVVSRD